MRPLGLPEAALREAEHFNNNSDQTSIKTIETLQLQTNSFDTMAAIHAAILSAF
jgi:hypothetical protein